eukprot:8003550-Lingulodinium_polyedra.AAC.1
MLERRPRDPVPNVLPGAQNGFHSAFRVRSPMRLPAWIPLVRSPRHEPLREGGQQHPAPREVGP